MEWLLQKKKEKEKEKIERVGIGLVANRFRDETFPDSRVFQFAYLACTLTLVIDFSFPN